jgi:transposase-like protein
MDKLTAKCRAVELVESGWTLSATGREIGVSTTTVHRWVVASGLTARRTMPRLTTTAKQTAVELVTAGLSINQVSRRLGISWPWIAKLVRDQSDAGLARSVSKPVRCACGALVNVVPCVACNARKQREQPSTIHQPDFVLPGTTGDLQRMHAAA